MHQTDTPRMPLQKPMELLHEKTILNESDELAINIIFSDKLTIPASEVKVYQDGIKEYVFGSIYNKDTAKLNEANSWTVELRHTSESNLAEFKALTSEKLNPGIPHGITIATSRRVVCFIPSRSGDLGIIESLQVVYHELAHMLLYLYYKNKRAKRRHKDKNAAAGSEGPFMTTEVHDRVFEKKLRNVEFFRDKIIGGQTKSVKFVTRGIDITDITDSRTVDRVPA